MKINLFTSSGKNAKKSISASSLTNVIPQIFEDKASGSVVIESIPGVSRFISVGSLGSINDEYLDLHSVYSGSQSESFSGRVYLLWFNSVLSSYELSSMVPGGSSVSIIYIGALTGASGDFSNFSNDSNRHGGKLIIADRNANKIWIVTMDNDPNLDTVASYTMPTGWALQTIDFQDGFFIGNIKDTTSNNEQIKFVSSEFGATVFTSSNFGLLTSSPGSILRVESDRREVWLWCDDHIEAWYNSAGDGFPFLRNSAAYIDVGLYARDSLVRFDKGAFFVGSPRGGSVGVYRMSGYSVEDITPTALKRDLSSGTYGLAAKYSIARPLRMGNFNLYIINFYSSELGTWCYSVDSGAWSQIKSNNMDWWMYIKGYAHTVFASAGTTSDYHFVIPYKAIAPVSNGVSNLPSIHVLKTDVFIEFDSSAINNAERDLIRSIISDHIYGDGNKYLFHRKLIFEFVPSAASVDIYWSDDDAATWVSVGAFSLVSGIVEKRSLGRSKDRIYKIECSSNADFSLINAWIEVDQGRY